MICNELKEKLPLGWKDKFVHRDLWDPEGYGVASFDLGGSREKVLVINFKTEDIMEYFYDDLPDNEWISLDRFIGLRFNKKYLLSPTKYFCNKKYSLKSIFKYSYKDKILDLFKIKPQFNNDYPKKKLYHNKSIPIHIMIGIIFVPNPNIKKYNIINHKDKNKSNFRKENLEWCDLKWNNQKEQKKRPSNKVVYKCIETGKIYTMDELSKVFSSSAYSSIWKCIKENKTYKKFHWKVINPTLEDYLSRHPLQDDWYPHPTMSNVRANGCGVLEVNGKLRVGNRSGRYYIIGLFGNFYRLHRLLFECFSGKLLNSNEIVDHIVPVTAEDCNNTFLNLRLSSYKENMNNINTKIRHNKEISQYDYFGNELSAFSSIKDAANICSIKKSGISDALSDKSFSYMGYLWSEKGNLNMINYKKEFLYSRWNKENICLSVSLEFSKVQPKKVNGGSSYSINKKYLNTGMPAPDGYYYQQGEPQNMIYDPSNKDLIKKREEKKWINRRTKYKKKS